MMNFDQNFQKVQVLGLYNLLIKQQIIKNTMNSSKIHELIDSDTKSLWIDPRFVTVMESMHILKDEAVKIKNEYENWKQDSICQINKFMGKFTSLMYREIQNKIKLQEELTVVKESNKVMKNEVLQLRQMIQDFVKSYNHEIQAKDLQIQELHKRLRLNSQTKLNLEEEEEISIIKTDSEADTPLQIIQQVSEDSAMTSLKSSMPNIVIEEAESSFSSNKRNYNQSSEKKKTKMFLDGFRKTIQESLNAFQQKQVQNHGLSNSSSQSDLMVLGDTDKINIPKKNESPKKMQFVKKSSNRLKTEVEDEDLKKSLTVKNRKRTLSFGSLSNEKRVGKSPAQKSRINVSKQKIKLTSKIIDENSSLQNNSLKKIKKTKTSVHLGGKFHLKKLAKELKSALQQLKIWEGLRHKEVKFEGERKNGQRWGKGKLLYDNGLVYEGSFAQNFIHGLGTMSLNQIVIYEGQFSLDELNGQGYIKSLKNLTESCPKFLSQASYCGQFSGNKFDGMGTLFLNQNEKFVTKFVQGVPVGQFTYYSHSQIQFGVWY